MTAVRNLFKAASLLVVAVLLTSCASMQRMALADAQRHYLGGNYLRTLRYLQEAEGYGSMQPQEHSVVLLMRASSLQQLQRTDAAVEAYEQVVSLYPQSAAAPTARQQLTIIEMHGQKHTGEFLIPTLFPLPQIVKMNTDGRTWECGFAAAQGNLAIIEYLQPGETVQDWTELVTVAYTIDGHRGGSARRLMDIAKELTLKDCPSTTWDILRESPDDILFEWAHPAEGNWPEQHEIARLITTDTGLYRISYVKKVSKLDAATYETWKSNIGSAVLD